MLIHMSRRRTGRRDCVNEDQIHPVRTERAPSRVCIMDAFRVRKDGQRTSKNYSIPTAVGNLNEAKQTLCVYVLYIQYTHT